MSYFFPGRRTIWTVSLLFVSLVTVSAQKSTQAFPTGLSYATYYDQRRTLFALLDIEHTDIVLLGDDLIDRGVWVEAFGNRYVKNRGVDADNLAGVAYRLDDVTKGKPGKILLHVGKRDLDAGLSPSLAAKYLGDIVQRIRKDARGTQVYVLSTLPGKNTPDSTLARYREYDRQVREKVPGITFVDLTAAATGTDGRLKEDFAYGNSPLLNGRGYRAVTEAIAPYVALSALDTAGVRDDYPLAGFVKTRNTILEYLPATTDDILMIGNSITNGGEWEELFRNPNVKNRGVSSDVSDGVLARLPRMLRVAPRKVFLMIGVNDLGNPPSKTVEYTIANVLKVVAEIHRLAPKTQVYVESLLPVNPTFPTFRSHTVLGTEIREVNQGLRRAAASNNFTFIDLHRSFTDPDGNLDVRYTNDGLHLTGEGYRLWRDVLMPYVKSAD